MTRSGLRFCAEIGKADDGLGKNDVLRIALALVHELMHLNAGRAMHLKLGQAIAGEHVHAGDKEGDVMARVPRRRGKGLQLAKIGAGAGDEQQTAAHAAKPSSRMRAVSASGARPVIPLLRSYFHEFEMPLQCR